MRLLSGFYGIFQFDGKINELSPPVKGAVLRLSS